MSYNWGYFSIVSYHNIDTDTNINSIRTVT